MSNKLQMKNLSQEKLDEMDSPIGKQKNFQAESKHITKYFYKVKNHQELYRLGKSFFQSYKMGVQSFAIGSTGFVAAQQRTILGIASYFDHELEMKIGIISNNFKNGCFSEMYKESDLYEFVVQNVSSPLYVKQFHDHFDLITFKDILSFASSQGPTEEYETVLSFIKGHYDVIFWDLPELHHIKDNPNLFFSIITLFDCLSLVVPENNASVKEVDEIRTFFASYGIGIKGLVVDRYKSK